MRRAAWTAARSADEQRVADIASAWAAGHLDDGDAVLIVDETADEKSPVGAARQYSGGLIPVTVPELLRLRRDIVIPPPRRDRPHQLHWSTWRRRHQHRARQAHQRWNASAETTPWPQRTTAAVKVQRSGRHPSVPDRRK